MDQRVDDVRFARDMLKPRLLAISIVLVATFAAARAQVPPQVSEITVDSRPSSAEILAWLNSDDPRLVAWGAHFTAASSDEAPVTALIQIVERWKASSRSDDVVAVERRNAMFRVLDALILRNEVVPAAGLAAIAPQFPAQAAILAPRLPRPEAAPLLQAWFENEGGDDMPLDRIAAMMLAHAPPPGFAARVLADSEEQLTVYIVDEGGYGSGMGGGSCGCGGGGALPKSWPPVFYYLLEENVPKTKDPLLVEAGGDRITFRRIAGTGGIGSCFGVRPLNAKTRYALILAMQGGDVQWKVEDSVSIQWKSPEEFLADLRKEIAAHEAQLRATVAAFAARKLVSPSEADSVRPMLDVGVEDVRKNPQAELPKPSSPDARTTISYSKF